MDTPSHTTCQVPEYASGQRLDNFLMTWWKKIPKSLLYRLIRQGKIRLNGKRTQPSERVQAEDIIRYPRSLHLPPQASAQPRTLPTLAQLGITVLYEDDRLVVINKPVGLAVHAGSHIPYGLVETLRLIWACPALELVHRLDRATSGCLLLAKRLSAHRALQLAWQEQAVHKHYWMLVHGKWPATLQTVDAPLSVFRYEGGERLITVDRRMGKTAITHFQVQGYGPGYTWVEAALETGRTHQIRVHAQYAGFPIMGDPRYGDREQDKQQVLVPKRLFLHARALAFPHPVTGEKLLVTADTDPAWTPYLQACSPPAVGD